MKNKFYYPLVLIVLTTINSNLHSQTFRSGFEYDIFGAGNQSQGYSYSSNVVNALNVHETEYLENFITMFQVTKDKKYLDLFIIHSMRVEKRRDDNIGNLSASDFDCFPASNTDLGCYNIYFPQTLQQIDPNSKGWSCIEDNDCLDNDVRVLHSAGLIIPLAEFVYYMQTDADFISFASEPVPEEALMPIITSFNPHTTVANYHEYAIFLQDKIEETISFHECNWLKYDIAGHRVGACDNSLGNTVVGYVHDCSSTNHDALNMDCTMGKALAYMYEVEFLEGNNALADIYHCHITDIRNLLFRNLQFNPNDANNISSYWWLDYDCTENTGHGALVMSFADLCHSLPITNSYFPSQPLFSLLDMQRFTNTFEYHIYKAPLNFADNVLGVNNSNYPTCVGTNTSSNSNLTGAYTFLCKYDPLVYQIVSDAWCESAIYHNGGDFSAFCQLAQYQHLFNPIAVKRGHNTTSYRASCSGDFYGNGAIEVASAIANSDISISSVNSTSHINTISVTNNQFNLSWRGMASGNMENQLLGDEVVTVTDNEIKIFNFSSGPTYIANLNNPGSQFNGVAVGEFDPDHQGPEILTEDNSDGRLHLYSYSASIISPLTLNNSFISNNLSGITVGNFDRMNPNEIAIFDNTSGHIKIFKILNNTLTLLYDYVITSSSLNYWNGITAGDFDGDGQDEIIGHRNLDGAFFVFKVKNSILGNPDGETFPIDQQNGVLCSAKLSIDQTKSALVTFRNFDGQITIFNMDGLCPNLNLSGQTINDASSIDYNPNYVAAIINNNFPLDYHVNNTLVAGNNFNIVSPSIVTFTAGNEIILKDGFTATTGCDFHAYIDPGIACNPQNFRVANPNVSNTNSVSQQPNSIKKSNEISVKPNPAEGKFTYFINEYEQKEIIYHICVIDLLGNIIYKEDRNSSSGEIDLSQYYNGVYFLRINSDDGKTWQERLIVSH